MNKNESLEETKRIRDKIRCKIYCDNIAINKKYEVSYKENNNNNNIKTGYHVTTAKKIQRYISSKRIIAPVRFFPNISTAQKWAKRTGRNFILKIKVRGESYPLPDYKPAFWSPNDVIEFKTTNILP